MDDPASIESQEETEAGLDAILAGVSLAVMGVITERMRSVEGLTLAEALTYYQEDIASMESMLAAGRSTTEAYTEQAYKNMAKGNEAWAKPYYKAANVEQIPIMQSHTMSQKVLNGIASVNKVTGDMMKTSALGIIDSSGKITALPDYYRSALADAVNAIKLGEETYQKAIAKTATTLSKSGLRVQYPKRTMELNAAVRMNIMDNYRQTMSELRWMQGIEFGADGVEVSAHGLCAPDHQPYQGKQFTLKQFDKIQEDKLAPRPLETGANCKHSVNPIILGISENVLSKKDVEALNRQSNEDVTITGLGDRELTMSRYEATQYQRGIERNLRKVNERIYLNPDDEAAKAAKKAYNAVYRRVTKEAGLTTRMERTKAYIAS